MIPFPRLLLPAACLLPLLSMAPGLLAQVPTGAVIILQGPPNPFGFDSYVIADPAGGGATVLPLQTSPLLFAETNALSVDPANANQVFLLNDANGFDPGIKLAPIGSMARTIGMASGQQFTQVGGTAMVVGSSRVFTLRAGGIVEATPKVGGAPFQLSVEIGRPDLTRWLRNIAPENLAFEVERTLAIGNQVVTLMRASSGQEEMDRMFGPNRLHTFKIRPDLPHFNAALMELRRRRLFAPGLPRMTLR